MANQKAIYKALENIGFETMGELCCGVWEGYAAELRPYNGGLYLDVAVRVDKKDKQLRKDIQRAVKENNSGHSLGCLNNGSFMSFLVKFNKKSPYEQQFAGFMRAITLALRQYGIGPACTCSVCGGGSPDSLCVMESYQPVHSACLKGMAAETREKAEENRENGSYLTGIIGAVLGMLVGLIPSLLTIMLADTIYGVLFALVPMASAWGYRKFKGKMSRGSIAIIVLLSFIGVFVMQYLVIGFVLMDEYAMGLGMAFEMVAENLLNVDGLMMVASESVVHFLFMLLGVWIAWRYMYQGTNAGKLRQIDAVMSTLRPNPSFAKNGADTGEESRS